MGMYCSCERQISIRQFIKTCEVLSLPKPIINEKEYYAEIDYKLYNTYSDWANRKITPRLKEDGLYTTISYAERNLLDIVSAYQEELIKFEAENKIIFYDLEYYQRIQKEVKLHFC